MLRRLSFFLMNGNASFKYITAIDSKINILKPWHFGFWFPRNTPPLRKRLQLVCVATNRCIPKDTVSLYLWNWLKSCNKNHSSRQSDVDSGLLCTNLFAVMLQSNRGCIAIWKPSCGDKLNETKCMYLQAINIFRSNVGGFVNYGRRMSYDSEGHNYTLHVLVQSRWFLWILIISSSEHENVLLNIFQIPSLHGCT